MMSATVLSGPFQSQETPPPLPSDSTQSMDPGSESQRPMPEKGSNGPSTWTGKRIAIVTMFVVMAVFTIILVVTLPIELRPRSSYRVARVDSSYYDGANRPKRVLENFPDPGLLQVNGTWYAFGTNEANNDTEVPRVPVAMSLDFINWTKLESRQVLLPDGDWETDVNHWAPDAMQRDDGRFVLYYSGELKDWKRHHCVGVAVTNNTSPLGPYVPQNTPLVCPLDQGGAIDPSPFKDADGKLYIVYKVDGNSIGNGGRCNNSKPPFKSVPIMLQELESNGTTPIGDPVQIFEHDSDEDGELVESPNLIRTAEGVYYLFYSSHCFISPEYDVKYATSPLIRGPYTRAKREFLRTGDFDLDGPGGATVSKDGTKMVFHANCDHERCMYVAGIHINSTALNATLTSLDNDVMVHESV